MFAVLFEVQPKPGKRWENLHRHERRLVPAFRSSEHVAAPALRISESKGY